MPIDGSKLRQFLESGPLGWLYCQVRAAAAPPKRLISAAQRAEIEEGIYEQSQMTSAYGFMLFSACGIAVLGLLQSSVAVVIGAMLISPLMGPIMALGMALARIEPRRFKSAAITLILGAVLSIAAAAVIVWLVPLREATPEVIARTRPTLLDLIIAVLSGFVGAYLTINRRAGAIAGVAIATALMPPLAVVGYGIATANLAYAAGALFLFLTNVVAILSAVFLVARRYGYGPAARKGPAWEYWGLAAAVMLLAIPLGLSLRDIVREAQESGRVQVAIAKVFRGATPHIAELDVRMEAHKPPNIQGVVITRHYVIDAAARIARDLGNDATVVIEQVVASEGLPKPDAISGTVGQRGLATLGANASPEARLRAMLAETGEVLAISETGNGFVVNLRLPPPAGLGDYRAIEESLRRLSPNLNVRITPPLRPLPTVTFGRGLSRLDDDGRRTVDLCAWALQRWQAGGAVVEGHSSATAGAPRPRDLRLAEARARAVADGLRAAGAPDVRVEAVVQTPDAGSEAASWSAAVRMAAAPSNGGETRSQPASAPAAN